MEQFHRVLGTLCGRSSCWSEVSVQNSNSNFRCTITWHFSLQIFSLNSFLSAPVHRKGHSFLPLILASFFSSLCYFCWSGEIAPMHRACYGWQHSPLRFIGIKPRCGIIKKDASSDHLLPFLSCVIWHNTHQLDSTATAAISHKECWPPCPLNGG